MDSHQLASQSDNLAFHWQSSGSWQIAAWLPVWRLVAGAWAEGSGTGLEGRGWKLLAGDWRLVAGGWAGGSGSGAGCPWAGAYLAIWPIGWLAGWLVD